MLIRDWLTSFKPSYSNPESSVKLESGEVYSSPYSPLPTSPNLTNEITYGVVQKLWLSACPSTNPLQSI